MDDSGEDDLEEDLELEIRQNQLVMVHWMLTHQYLIVPLRRLTFLAWAVGARVR